MEDIELVLRFVAHYTFRGVRPDDQNLDEFLNNTVEERSVLWNDEKWDEIDSASYRALNAAPKVFGRFAFRKYHGPNESRRPINRGLFETETLLLALRSPRELSVLVDRSDQVLHGLAQLFRDSDFASALLHATGRGSSSNTRLKLLGELLGQVIHA